MLKAVLCISAFCTATLTSVTPAVAYDGALPVSINQIMMETGGNIKHDTDMLRYKRDEKAFRKITSNTTKIANLKAMKVRL